MSTRRNVNRSPLMQLCVALAASIQPALPAEAPRDPKVDKEREQTDAKRARKEQIRRRGGKQ